MPKKSWRFANAQKTLSFNLDASKVIYICDVCGREISQSGTRHSRCITKLSRAPELVHAWCQKALQREIATQKTQSPPLSPQVLARLAKIDIDVEFAKLIEHPPGSSNK